MTIILRLQKEDDGKNMMEKNFLISKNETLSGLSYQHWNVASPNKEKQIVSMYLSKTTYMVNDFFQKILL